MMNEPTETQHEERQNKKPEDGGERELKGKAMLNTEEVAQESPISLVSSSEDNRGKLPKWGGISWE